MNCALTPLSLAGLCKPASQYSLVCAYLQTACMICTKSKKQLEPNSFCCVLCLGPAGQHSHNCIHPSFIRTLLTLTDVCIIFFQRLLYVDLIPPNPCLVLKMGNIYLLSYHVKCRCHCHTKAHATKAESIYL